MSIATRLKCCSACSARLRSLSSRRISVDTTKALRPSSSTIVRVSSSASCEREASTRLAPSLAYARAIARPIPRPPPVMTAILFSSSIRFYLLYEGCVCTCETQRSEEHTSELQSRSDLVCRLLLEKKKEKKILIII